MMYSLRPPDVASIYAIRQFLRLFPWVRFFARCGRAPEEEQEEEAGPTKQAAVEKIGQEPQGELSLAAAPTWQSFLQEEKEQAAAGIGSWYHRNNGGNGSGVTIGSTA